jgi:hypothetical protein
MTPGDLVRLVVPKDTLERHAGTAELTVEVES